MKKIKYISIIAISAISFSSCSLDDENPQLINEEEIITTIIATFTNGENVVTMTSYDEDGDGPVAPVVSVNGNFTAGETYSGTIQFVNQSVLPEQEITEEVEAEGDEHQIFFQHNGLGTFSYADEDVNGNPIGLNFSFTASSTPTTGNLTITLIHEPDKFAEGVSGGIPTHAGGSTDAEVIFPVVVE